MRTRTRFLLAVLVLMAMGLLGWRWRAAAEVATATAKYPTQASRSEPVAVEPHAADGDLAKLLEQAHSCQNALLVTLRERWRQLPARNEARSMLTYVQLFELGRGSLPAPLAKDVAMRRAIDMAPDDAEVVWEAWQQCALPGCDKQAMLRRVLLQEPHNLNAWLFALGEAEVNHDAAAFETAMRNAADAKYVDPGIDLAFARMVEAFDRLPMPAACASPMTRLVVARMDGPVRKHPIPTHDALFRRMLVTVAMAGARIPTYSTLRTTCLMEKPDRPLTALRRNQCQRINTTLAHSDWMIDRVIGIDAMEHLSRGTDEHAYWQRQRNELAWVRDNMGTREMPLDYGTRAITEGEMPTLIDLLRQDGRWPPPRDWQPDHAQ